MNNKQYKYTIVTDDDFEAQAMLKATKMQAAIDGYYQDVIRYYIKYANLSDEQCSLIDEVAEKLRRHFEDCFSDEA